MESLIQKLEYEAFRSGVQARSAESRKWFMDKLKNMKSINRQSLLKDESLVKSQRVLPGRMYMYFYDPKHRKTLPYYDAFPLVIAVEPAPGGFYGLNLHYLPLKLRARLFDALLETTNNRKYDETTKFKINYSKLKSISKMKYFAPCFKHYLTSQMEKPLAMVEAPEWEIALFMPTQQFRKASASKVWAESRKMGR
jgi:hypothetical protein